MKNLSKAQRVVLAIGLVLIILSFLFPCWTESASGVGMELRQDYRFILAPPQHMSLSDSHLPAIDISHLVIQLVVVTAVTVGTMILLPPKNSD